MTCCYFNGFSHLTFMVRLFCFLCAIFAGLSLKAETPLFEKNRWNVAIIIPENPEVDEFYAGQTLVDWCERVTGQRPELIEENSAIKNYPTGIFIGRTASAKAALISVPESEGDVAIRVIHDGSVFLLGNRPHATRIAVGRFCEQVLGVTFAFPGERGADWEIKKEIPLASFDLFQPDFKWRRITGLSSDDAKEWALNIGYGRTPDFSHGLYAAFNQKIWEQDPTLLADLGQGRVKPTGNEFAPNPNLAHPQAPAVGAAFVREWFQKYPQAFSAPMGVNDSMIFDQSVPSEGWFRDRPVRTDYVMGFLNKVAELNWKPDDDPEGKKHAIGTLAYLQTQRAPTIRLNPAIFPWVCADRIGYAIPEFAQQDTENLANWVKSGAKRVGVYDYWYGAGYAVPRIHFTAQSESIHAAHQVGVVGWYAELGAIWAFDAPKAWLGAKKCERPHADSESLLDQWFQAAYGPGAIPMRNVYRTIEAAWDREIQRGGKNQWIQHFLHEDSALILQESEIKAIDRCIQVAEENLRGSSTLRNQNYQWRLNQFKDAWTLSQKFREVVLARRAKPMDASSALVAYQNLIACEQSYQATEDSFNFQWGRYGAFIKWSDWVNTDPRMTWGDLISQDPTLVSTLRELVAKDTIGLSGIQQLWRDGQKNAVVVHQPKTSEEFLQAWTVQLGGRKDAEKSSAGLFKITHETGSLTRQEKVSSDSLIKFSVGLKPVAGKVRVSLKFLTPKKPVMRAVECDATSGVIVLPVPKGATEVECKILFEDSVDLISAEIQSLALPR